MSTRTQIEALSIDLNSGWDAFPGVPGLEVKYLSNDMNEGNHTGGRARFVRFASGAATTEAFVHSYWEEVYLVSGDLSPVDSAGEVVAAQTYSLRPPGTPHGPFRSREGCVLFEVQYFAK